FFFFFFFFVLFFFFFFLSVLTDNAFTLHPKRVVKQGVSELLTPFLLAMAANWRQRLARWRQI
ncbi:hypothetical protein, partial [Salmonella enterica]|uniref:hypothetical protein n=1 Tax=Salmonella enterica TaxID=28901 RepID=UPI001C391937